MSPTLNVTPRAGYPAQEVEAIPAPDVDGFLLYHYRDEYSGHEIFTCRQGEQGLQHGVRVTVSEPRIRSWGDPVPARVSPEFMHSMKTDDIRLMASLMVWAAAFADQKNHGLEAQAEAERQRREEERKKREEEERKAREERERRAQEERERRAALEAPIRAWRADVQETLQWHVGGWLRLLRWNMRATVFGTLEHVELHETRFGRHEGYIELTTEKGKYMRLTFEELEVVQLRDEDERDYTPIPLADHPEYDSPVRRERREIAGGTGAARKDRLVTGE